MLAKWIITSLVHLSFIQKLIKTQCKIINFFSFASLFFSTMARIKKRSLISLLTVLFIVLATLVPKVKAWTESKIILHL